MNSPASVRIFGMHREISGPARSAILNDYNIQHKGLASIQMAKEITRKKHGSFTLSTGYR